LNYLRDKEISAAVKRQAPREIEMRGKPPSGAGLTACAFGRTVAETSATTMENNRIVVFMTELSRQLRRCRNKIPPGRLTAVAIKRQIVHNALSLPILPLPVSLNLFSQ